MIKCSSHHGLCPRTPNMHLSCRIDYCTLLSLRVEREIVFEQNAKSYNFERGFFFYTHTPLPNPPPLGRERCTIILHTRHTERSEISHQSRRFFNKKTSPLLGESSKLKQLLFRIN